MQTMYIITLKVCMSNLGTTSEYQNEKTEAGTGSQRIQVSEFPFFVNTSKRTIEYEFQVRCISILNLPSISNNAVQEIERLSPIKANRIASRNSTSNRYIDICPCKNL